MSPKNCASTLVMIVAAGVCSSHRAAAADPPQVPASRAGGGEVTEFGGFQCTAKRSDGEKLTWTCPAQSFGSKFKEAPVVFFSIAGFEHILPADGGLSLGVDTKDDVAKDGFQPIISEKAGKPAGADNSTIDVTWIAVGEGERVQKPKLTREEKIKLREKRAQEKTKSQ